MLLKKIQRGVTGGLLFLSLGLGGCGFSPLLSKKVLDQSVSTHLMKVKVERIPERMGQKLRSLLSHKMGGGAPFYGLEIHLEKELHSIGMALDSTTNRYQLRLEASFLLKNLKDPSREARGVTQALCSWNVLTDANPITGSSEYSNVASQEAALDHALDVVAEDIYRQVASILAQNPSLEKAQVEASQEDSLSSREASGLFSDWFDKPVSLATDVGEEKELDS